MFSSENRANFEQLIEHLSKKLNASILVGAGVSVASGVPTSARIVRILRRLRLIDGHPDYAAGMEKAFKTKHQRRAFLERLFLGKPPSQEHYSLAHLVGKHVFETVFTTNFDHLAEIALSQVCSEPVHSYLTRTGLESIDKRALATRIVKLHGDFLFSSLANTDEEMGHAITDSMRLKFSALLEQGSLVVLGYAGDGSILEMLQELAAVPEILSHGVWWILHCRAESDSLPETPQHVVKFLSEIRATGKRAILIRNSLGAQWFLDSLCRRVTGEAPLKPTFGIGTTQTLAPQVVWTPTPQLARSRTVTPQKFVDELQQAASSSSLIFLRGSTDSEKTRLISRFVSENRERPCFYFSFAFARNNPEDYSFLSALGAFLDDQDLLDEDPNARFWVENLLDHNGIIVLDDLPVSLDKTRRAVKVGTCRASFVKVFYPALLTLKKLSKGNLIVCLPDLMPDTWLGDFLNIKSIAPELAVTEISMPVSSNEVPTASSLLKSLGPTERRILPTMATLRFAESADFIGSIAKVHDSILASLHHLVELGVVKEYGARFLVRIPYRVKLLGHMYNTWPTRKLIDLVVNVARSYEKAAEDPEAPTSSRHCLLEAENAYFEASIGFGAGTWIEGMKALVRTSLELANSPLSRDFIFDTLKSYFEAVGEGIFLGLDLRDLSTLFSAFDVATASKDERFRAVVNSFFESLRKRNELLPAWLMAGSAVERDNGVSPEGSSKILMVKEQLRAKKRHKALSADDWMLLGRSYLALNRCFNVLYAGTQRRGVLQHSIRYAKLGLCCFKQVRDEIGKRDSLRFLGLTYMLGGNYRLARKTLVPLFRTEIAEAGFDPFKAASLNNLYCVYLGVGALRLAEGYFWEANYQYAYSGRHQSVLSLITLAIALHAQPGRRVFERHPRLRNAIPSLDILLDKMIHAWNRCDREDKRDSFFRVSEGLMIISACFEEAHDVSKELQALTFLVKVHEDCFAEPESDSGKTRLPQKLTLERLRKHLLRCIDGGRFDPRNIHSMFNPIRTQAMKDLLQNLASGSAQNRA
jgi:hypothetical protein